VYISDFCFSISSSESLARPLGDGHIVNGHIKLVLVGSTGTEEYNEKVVNFAECDLSPDPGRRGRRAPHYVHLSRSTSERPGQDLESSVASI
jgi:hypothetical protein